MVSASAHPHDLIDQVEERIRVQEQHQAAGGGDDDRDEARRRGLPDLRRLSFFLLSGRRGAISVVHVPILPTCTM